MVDPGLLSRLRRWTLFHDWTSQPGIPSKQTKLSESRIGLGRIIPKVVSFSLPHWRITGQVCRDPWKGLLDQSRMMGIDIEFMVSIGIGNDT